MLSHWFDVSSFIFFVDKHAVNFPYWLYWSWLFYFAGTSAVTVETGSSQSCSVNSSLWVLTSHPDTQSHLKLKLIVLTYNLTPDRCNLKWHHCRLFRKGHPHKAFSGQVCESLLGLLFVLQDKEEVNSLNKYSHNFFGEYCTCSRPYPDPDDQVRHSSPETPVPHLLWSVSCTEAAFHCDCLVVVSGGGRNDSVCGVWGLAARQGEFMSTQGKKSYTCHK